MLNLNKIMFFTFLFMGSFITICSYSWVSMWIGLEINLLSFISIISNSMNKFSSESSMKYFIIQSISSSIFLFSILMLYFNMTESFFLSSSLMMILMSSLFMKLGAAPFHFWFPEVMEGLNWMECFLLLTWQKVAPMVLLIYVNNSIIFIFIVIISCMVVSGVMGQNQVSIRKFMAYSSINHMGWMISSILLLENMWFIYYLVYSLISLNLILMFYIYNIYFMKQMILTMSSNYLIKMFFIMNFLSMGGLPPFLGFLPKWMVIQSLTDYGFLMLSLLLIIFTLFTLFFYIRITLSVILMLNSFVKSKSIVIIKPVFIIILNFISLFSLILCTFLFSFI